MTTAFAESAATRLESDVYDKLNQKFQWRISTLASAGPCIRYRRRTFIPVRLDTPIKNN